MSLTLSIEIFQDTDDELFRWVFLDSSGQRHGPSAGHSSRSAAWSNIEAILANFLEHQD